MLFGEEIGRGEWEYRRAVRGLSKWSRVEMLVAPLIITVDIKSKVEGGKDGFKYILEVEPTAFS